MVHIEILSGPDSGKVVELDPGRRLVGRHASVDLRLAADSVSGKHLELEISQAGEVRFRDLGSTNGTWSGGLKVEQGEWFPGSELRLGSLKLRLRDPSESAPAAAGEDAELHRRAVQEALSGRRRGGPWLLVVLLLLVGGAGGAYWLLSRPAGDGATGGAPGEVGAGQAAAQRGPADLLDGYGGFEDELAEAWQLGAGVERIAGGVRSRGGAARMVLGPRFALDGCALQVRAEVDGLAAWPWFEIGREGEERAFAAWAGSNLADGPASLRLPCEAGGWFQLHLLLQGSGELSSVTVVAQDEGGAATTVSLDRGRSATIGGANLLLRHLDGSPLVIVTGAGGSWSVGDLGMRFDPSGDSTWLELRVGTETAESGPTLLFSDGGPVGVAAGVVVEDCPGLLLGGEARRMWMPFDPPLRAVCRGGRVRLEPRTSLELSWDLSTPLAEGARTARAMRRADREGDDQALLETSALLLRDYPFDEAQVSEAIQLRRAAIERGRRDLGQLQVQVAEAVFLSSADAMRVVEAQARELAARLPRTDVARQAGEIADLLASNIRQSEQEDEARRLEYRRRLTAALERSYPLLAAWVGGEGTP